MLYLIGLGLGDAKDISVRGLEVVKSAKKVFLEAYTSILSVDKESLVSIFVTCFRIVISRIRFLRLSLCFRRNYMDEKLSWLIEI